jgi:Rad3-related DNA helicase|tara:strand:+ start:1895 stop:3625 length:1731 start_codon:yes stop_codon:yes gene_type:complete
MLERSIDQIIDDALASSIFGKGFEFRKNQREIITKICEAYKKDPDSTVVIDAPTGSGKSLIAMWSSHVMKEMGKRGYLVTSDLTLQDQYESDFMRLKLNWPSIRGVDNYECSVNGLPFSLGDCKLKGMGYEAAKELSCYSSCEYLQNRSRAIDQPIALLNYAFWLIQRNYVDAKMKLDDRPVPFEKRDFVFFDEAHKIDEIVQGHFSPRVDPSLVDKILEATRFSNKQGFGSSAYTRGKLTSLINDLMKGDKSTVFEALQEFDSILKVYGKIRNEGNKAAKLRYKSQTLPRDWQKAFGIFDRLKDTHCKINDYVALIKSVGVDKMVLDQREEESTFKCVEEALMINKYLHEKSGFKVFMSATIGDPRSFVKIMGIKNAQFIRLDNVFNYDKSPVVFINRHKLTYREKVKSLPHVVAILDQIIDKHKGQRGIVHTGSYEFTNYIKQNTKHPFRIMDYENSKEKAGMIELFKKKENAVLMGPSLLEGLDLKDDISRFQIFFKVPYPNLNEPLIKAKLNKSNEWYDWKTGISVMQGVGRSVRSESDWAITYILDASFKNLINKKGFFPPSFLERLKTIR